MLCLTLLRRTQSESRAAEASLLAAERRRLRQVELQRQAAEEETVRQQIEAVKRIGMHAQRLAEQEREGHESGHRHKGLP